MNSLKKTIHQYFLFVIVTVTAITLFPCETFGNEQSDFHKTNLKHKELVYQSLDHPTSILLRGVTSGSDYLKSQQELIESVVSRVQLVDKEKVNGNVVLFGKSLSEKEIASLFHQKDLFTAYLENESLKKSLGELGFDSESYLRGSYDSDLGKLASYQELFTQRSAKSDLLFLFLQGKGPYKSVRETHIALKEMNEEVKPFLNPELSKEKLRDIFRRYPILRGFLHELPGMIDAVLAFEMGVISAKEFREQIHVNLFHCGPAAGYWGRLQEVFLPAAFSKKGDEEVLKSLFAGSLFEKGHGDHPYYGNPSTFESYISTLFDRLSQATQGGYLKIDWEIGGNPLKNANNLLLKTNVPWTIEQLESLREQAISGHLLSEKQKALILTLIEKSIQYLTNYQKHIHQALSFKENLKGKLEEKNNVMTLTLSHNNEKFVLTYDDKLAAYFSNGHILGEKQMRVHLHYQLKSLFKAIERDLGDPFHGLKWP